MQANSDTTTPECWSKAVIVGIFTLVIALRGSRYAMCAGLMPNFGITE